MKKIYLFIAIGLLSHTMLQSQSYLSPKPIREKKVFLITDLGYTSSLSDRQRGSALNSEFGIMTNINSGFALGGSLHAAFADNGTNYYVKLRARKWISDEMSINFAPGIELSNKKIMVSLDFHLNKCLAITTQIEPVQTHDGIKYPISAGVKLSSNPGLAANLVAIIGTLVVIASWDGMY